MATSKGFLSISIRISRYQDSQASRRRARPAKPQVALLQQGRPPHLSLMPPSWRRENTHTAQCTCVCIPEEKTGHPLNKCTVPNRLKELQRIKSATNKGRSSRHSDRPSRHSDHPSRHSDRHSRSRSPARQDRPSRHSDRPYKTEDHDPAASPTPPRKYRPANCAPARHRLPAVAEATVAVVMATTAEVTNVTVATDRGLCARRRDRRRLRIRRRNGRRPGQPLCGPAHGGTAGPCSIQRQRGLRPHHQ
jgi:hypothetical protein